MKGKIVKGVGGFYYVHLHFDNRDINKVYECKAKGSFRNQKIKPKIGDDVEIDILDEEKLLGNIIEIYPRSNTLLRPAVANVDQAIIVFALIQPEPNFNLLDRFLIMMDRQELETIICISKSDLSDRLKDSDKSAEYIKSVYEACGYKTIICSNKSGEGIDEIRDLVKGKTTVFAGPSGVGKSSLLNSLAPETKVETGSISEKIKRGKHTTRHSELMCIGEDTFIMDTPGFSSLLVEDMEPENLKEYYNEFLDYSGKCRFNGCIHINEPDCAVKSALSEGTISELRYNNYKQMYEELKSQRRW